MKRKIQIVLDGSSMAIVADLAEAMGTRAKSKVIREALGIAHWMLTHARNGQSIAAVSGERVDAVLETMFDVCPHPARSHHEVYSRPDGSGVCRACGKAFEAVVDAKEASGGH